MMFFLLVFQLSETKVIRRAAQLTAYVWFRFADHAKHRMIKHDAKGFIQRIKEEVKDQLGNKPEKK